jgi:hypothetical protein
MNKYYVGQRVTFSKKVTDEIDKYKSVVIQMVNNNPYVTIYAIVDATRYKIDNPIGPSDAHVWTENELMPYAEPCQFDEELFTL